MGTFLDGVHESPMGELIKAVLARPDVKIVNNSWGDSLFFLDALFTAKSNEEKTKTLTDCGTSFRVTGPTPFWRTWHSRTS